MEQQNEPQTEQVDDCMIPQVTADQEAWVVARLRTLVSMANGIHASRKVYADATLIMGAIDGAVKGCALEIISILGLRHIFCNLPNPDSFCESEDGKVELEKRSLAMKDAYYQIKFAEYQIKARELQERAAIAAKALMDITNLESPDARCVANKALGTMGDVGKDTQQCNPTASDLGRGGEKEHEAT